MAGGGTRNLFTTKEDAHLVKYLAIYKPTPAGRLGNKLYQALEENQGKKWPWARFHTWQSWRERYKKNQEYFDRKIRKYQRENTLDDGGQDIHEGNSTRVRETPDDAENDETENNDGPIQKSTHHFYTPSDDEHLVEYIATNGLDQGRLGQNLYKTLFDNEDGEWPWAKLHPWQSWRQRYKNNQEKFENEIRAYLKRAKQQAQSVKITKAKPDPKPYIEEDKSTHLEEKEKRKQVSDKAKLVKSAAPAPPTKSTEPQRPPPNGSTANDKRKEKPPAPKPIEAQPDALQAARAHRHVNGAGPSGTSNHGAVYVEIATSPKPVNTNAGKNNSRQASIPPIKTLIEHEDEGVADSQDDSNMVFEEHDTMLSLFGPEEPEDDELDESQSVLPEAEEPSQAEIVPQPSPPPAPPSPEKENVLVPSSSPITRTDGPQLQPPRKKPQRKLRQQKDDDPFESSPSSSPAKHSTTKSRGNPPMLIEGPFRNQLKRVRSRGDDTDEAGPPKRPRKNPEPEDKMEVDDAPPSAEAPTKQTAQGKTTIQQASKSRAASTRPQAPQPQPNAVASSSKVKLPDSPVRHHEEAPIASSTAIPPKKVAAPQAIPHEPKVVNATTAQHAIPIRPEIQPQSVKDVLAEQTIVRRESGQSISADAFSDSDVFTASRQLLSDKAKGKARAKGVLDAKPPRINLHRESLHRRMNPSISVSSHRKSGMSSRASSVSISTSSRHRTGDSDPRDSSSTRQSLSGISVASTCVTALAQIALKAIIGMARQYGVPDELAVSIFERVESLEKTEVVLIARYCGLMEEFALSIFARRKTVEKTRKYLEEMRKAMVETDRKLAKQEEEEEDSSDGEQSENDERPSGLFPRGEILRAEERRESRSHEKRHSRGSRGRPSLIIRPLPAEQEEVLSDYAPPTGSRAGQYARLEKQGRTEEARERERRRIRLPQTQTQTPREPSATVSPTPQSRMQSQSQMLGDIAMEVDNDDEIGAEVDEGYEAEVLENDENQEDFIEEKEEEEDVVEESREDGLMEGDDQDVAEENDGNVEMEEYDDQDESNGIYEPENDEEIDGFQFEQEMTSSSEFEQEQEEGQAEQQHIVEEEHGLDEDVEKEDHGRNVVVEEDGDDIYMPETQDMPEPEQPRRQEEANESQQAQPAAKEASEPPAEVHAAVIYPTTRTLLKRVSGGREKEPAFVALAAEHRRLAFEANADNVNDLKAFEAKHNPDLLRLWSIKWAKEMMKLYDRHPKEQQPEIIELSD